MTSSELVTLSKNKIMKSFIHQLNYQACGTLSSLISPRRDFDIKAYCCKKFVQSTTTNKSDSVSALHTFHKNSLGGKLNKRR